MSLELTITAKGQFTLRQSVLDHLGVRPGAKVSVSLLPGGKVEILPAATDHDIRAVRGRLRRPGQAPVSLEAMQDAIEAGAST